MASIVPYLTGQWNGGVGTDPDSRPAATARATKRRRRRVPTLADGEGVVVLLQQLDALEVGAAR
ncbi:hypothetical protein, partial [Streptomyces sp900116325]|uniref:hypothetical protein n=1 Tax=Streptomyces sp. 900116325 TaxID=3154295 RepID=UPI0033AD4D81